MRGARLSIMNSIEYDMFISSLLHELGNFYAGHPGYHSGHQGRNGQSIQVPRMYVEPLSPYAIYLRTASHELSTSMEGETWQIRLTQPVHISRIRFCNITVYHYHMGL